MMAATRPLHRVNAPGTNLQGRDNPEFTRRISARYDTEIRRDQMPGTRLQGRAPSRRLHDLCHVLMHNRLVWVPGTPATPSPHDLTPIFTLHWSRHGLPKLRFGLLGDNNDKTPRDVDDECLRERIWRRSVAANGLSYPDGKEVLDWIPRSNTSLCTHGDISPRNIVVYHDVRIIALLDWKASWLVS